MNNVTRILSQISGGDAQAASQLLPLVYNELRALAAARLTKETPGNTLSPTALVHEAYVRLVGPSADQGWANKAHFFSAAATAMRRILIERARKKRIRIHARRPHDLQSNVAAAPEPADKLLALDAALIKFAEHDPLKARLVELRYFAGLSGDQVAEILGISPSTADRHWVYARAWLRNEIEVCNEQGREHPL
jgi:RNA polymerase sigma factor (TIGR02999 family)